MPDRLAVSCWCCGYTYYMMCADSGLPKRSMIPERGAELIETGEIRVDTETAVEKINRMKKSLEAAGIDTRMAHGK